MKIQISLYALIASLTLLVAAVHAEREYSRSVDFAAETARPADRHTHGGLLAPEAMRWSYCLIPLALREAEDDLGHLLSRTEKLVPLRGFSEREIRNHFRLHDYTARKDSVFLTWNKNAEHPASELKNAHLAILFHVPEDGTWSVVGDMKWRSVLPPDMRRGVGLTIGILRPESARFKTLFQIDFEAMERFEEPKPVAGFAGNPALTNLKLQTEDRIVFLWRSDRANYRGLEGIDGDIRIVHAEGESLGLSAEEIQNHIAYQQLFSLIDLERPDLITVKKCFVAEDYPGAMSAYIQVLAQRIALLPPHENFSFWLYGPADADRLIEGELSTVRYGDTTTSYTFEIGEPGNINFFKAATADYKTTMRDTSSMQWTAKHATAHARTRDPKYLDAWLATWDDFARHWEEQYGAIKKDPEVYGRRPDGRTKLIGIDWLNAQLYLAWRLESLHKGLTDVLRTAHEAGQLDQIESAQMARILIRMATVETARSETWLDRADKLVPNQIRHLAQAMFTWGVQFSEFRDADWWREKSVPIFTLTHNPDGSDREHSFNYFKNNLPEAILLLRQIPPDEQDAELIADLEQRSINRDRFLPALVRPDGFTPAVGKGNIWRHYGESQPVDPFSTAFTSILFPYVGCGVQRSGWGPEALYLFMKLRRPSIGHWRAQDGGLQLAAYGRNLLVSALGEMYDKRDKERGFSDYWYSAAGQNTVLVDGLSAKRRTGDFDRLDPWLWHTSPHFDFMETFINGPYGGWDFRSGDEVSTPVTGVIHHRQVHFLREAGCWIITDRIVSEVEHDYTQTWCFGPEYTPEQVEMDVHTGQIKTREAAAPNLSLYQAATARLDYRKYYGVNEEGKVLGWVGILEERETWQYRPAVDAHVNWKSRGSQLLITLVVPHADLESPVQKFNPVKNEETCGFEAVLRDGRKIDYLAAPTMGSLKINGIRARAASLLVFQENSQVSRGMALGAESFQGKKLSVTDFEFDTATGDKIPLTAPQGFRWQENPAGARPDYIGYHSEE